MKRRIDWPLFLGGLFGGALAVFLIALLAAAGPGTITFPNTTPYGVTFGGSGEYHSTTALVDISNPNLGINVGQQTMANSLPVSIASNQSPIPVSGVATGGVADTSTFTQGSSLIQPIGGEFNSSFSLLTSGQTGSAAMTNDRMIYFNLGKVGGTTVDVNSGNKSAGTQRMVLATDQPNLTAPLNVSVTSGTTGLAAATTGGCSPYHLAGGSAASTNSTSIKGAAGTLCDLTVVNTTSVLYYLKIYDSSSAPTCSSATNIKHVIPIPQANGAGGGLIRSLTYGEAYANGIGYCLTGGGGDTDNTNAAVGVFIEASFK